MAGWNYAKVSGVVVGTSANDEKVAKTKAMLTSFSDALISIGWALDERFSSTSDVHVLFSSDAYCYCSIGLKNALGAKLMLAYSCMGYSSYSKTVGDPVSNASGSHLLGGLMMSMIPPNSDDEFEFGTTLSVPSTATRIVAMSHGTSYSSLNSLTANGGGEIGYAYHFLTKGNVVIVVFRNTADDTQARARGFVVGEIFASLAHKDDSGCGCRFGAFELAGHSSSEQTAAHNSGINVVTGFGRTTHYSSEQSQAATFKRADGSHVPSMSVTFSSDINAVAASLCCSARYVPLWMAESSNTPADTGVVPGDGFKGFISTDIIRMVDKSTYNKGQKMNGGEFIHIGNGVCIAWDPSIIESIF